MCCKRQPQLVLGAVRLLGGPVLDCTLEGITPPTRLPEVVWRAGIDLNPLDAADPADVAWLEALIWPEQAHRRAGGVYSRPPTLSTGRP